MERKKEGREDDNSEFCNWPLQVDHLRKVSSEHSILGQHKQLPVPLNTIMLSGDKIAA